MNSTESPRNVPYSLRKILWNDWPTLAAAMGIPIIWAIYAGFPLLKRGIAPLPVILPGVASVALALVVGWRIRRVSRLFAHGERARGTIFDLHIAKDRGRLVFLFEVNGTRIRAWMPVHKTKDVLAMKPGRKVEVLYDAEAPKRAIVRELYER